MKRTLFELKNYFTYQLERFLIRGTHYRLLTIATLLVVISFLAGLLMLLLTADFSSLGEAGWWAFLRLSDPGYLGDDEGTVRRVISTIVTVLGYVLFMGSLVAIMTQWLDSTLEQLEKGETPIARKNHILILGWTERVPVIVSEILLSEGRVKRFLKLFGESKLEIVILAEGSSGEYRSELRTSLGPLWNERKITIRSGNSLRIAHLERVAYSSAAVLIVPGSDVNDADELNQDTSVIKTLLTASGSKRAHDPAVLPRAVVELLHSEQTETAKNAYKGELQTIVSREFVSRLIVQNIRHPGLSFLYSALLTHSDGQAIFVREVPQVVGKSVKEIESRFKSALFLGLVRPAGKKFVPLLAPPPEESVREGDRIVALSNSFESLSEFDFVQSGGTIDPALVHGSHSPDTTKILVLGWSRKSSCFIQELGSYTDERFQVTMLSQIEVSTREEELGDVEGPVNVMIHHLVGDYAIKSTLQGLDLSSFNSIVILSSHSLTTREDTDARSLIGYLHLHALLSEVENKPQILIEILSSANLELIDPRVAEVIPTGLLVSHLLAQVSLRPELLSIFEVLFGFGGTEVFMHPVEEYCAGLQSVVSFQELQEYARARGEMALGVLQTHENNAVILNPPNNMVFPVIDGNHIVVLVPEAEKDPF